MLDKRDFIKSDSSWVLDKRDFVKFDSSRVLDKPDFVEFDSSRMLDKRVHEIWKKTHFLKYNPDIWSFQPWKL